MINMQKNKVRTIDLKLDMVVVVLVCNRGMFMY